MVRTDSVYAAKKPYFFESEHYLEAIGDREIVIIDGGSRGDLFDPFNHVQTKMHVIAFEPDPDHVKRTKQGDTKTTFINRGLWSHEDVVKLHLNVARTTSSVYPPNTELLSQFSDTVGVPPRTVEQIIEVPAISIDEAVEQGLMPTPHFIKLDIHSAEFEALQGAIGVLSGVVGVLVESWHSPIHAGQRLHADIEAFLNKQGFNLFHFNPLASWHQHVDSRHSPRDRSRLIASESLFLRDSPADDWDETTILFAVGCADLFRYTNHAILMTRRFKEEGLLTAESQTGIEAALTEIIMEREKRGLGERIRSWIGRRLGL